MHKSVKTPNQPVQQPVQWKEILDYTKEMEVKGGLHVILKVDCSLLPSRAHRDVVQRTAKIIANRLRLFCSDEKISFGVYIAGDDEIIVQLPSALERERALSLICKTGYIEFKVVSDDAEKIRQVLKGNTPQGYELKYLNGQPLLLGKETSLTDVSFKNVFVQVERQFSQTTVVLEFDSKGTQIFSNVTAANVGKRLAVLLDGKVVSTPIIREVISSGQVHISGFSVEEANDISVILKGGALPAVVMIEEERTVSGIIGFDLQRPSGVIAEVRFFAPISIQKLKENLHSQGISSYIQMLDEKELYYLFWLKADAGQAKKVIKDLTRSNTGEIFRMETISERIKPDLERESISESESSQFSRTGIKEEVVNKITITLLTRDIPDSDYFVERSKVFKTPFDMFWATTNNRYFAKYNIISVDPVSG